MTFIYIFIHSYCTIYNVLALNSDTSLAGNYPFDLYHCTFTALGTRPMGEMSYIFYLEVYTEAVLSNHMSSHKNVAG